MSNPNPTLPGGALEHSTGVHQSESSAGDSSTVETATDEVLTVDGISKRYGDLEAVSDLSFSVRRGEFLTLLGPSGCGKSTTLMAIAGFERPDSGTVLLNGKDISDLPPDKRGMGVVFQNYALFPHMTALENVLFPLRMRDIGRDEAEEKAREALDLVQLPNPNARPSQLSGGQMQRVALARALVFDPAVLLMDEPLAALDRRLRQDMQFEIRRIQSKLDTTVIYVTHDQEEALVLSDRIAVMRSGRFEQVASPREIYDVPVNGFVANFLGESNTASVRVAEADGQTCRLAVYGGADAEWYGVGAVPSGSDALLVLRPEDILIVDSERDGEHDESVNASMATVTDVAFLGDHMRVEVELQGAAGAATNGRWTVRAKPRTSAATHRIGDTVGLRWPVALARVVEP